MSFEEEERVPVEVELVDDVVLAPDDEVLEVFGDVEGEDVIIKDLNFVLKDVLSFCTLEDLAGFVDGAGDEVRTADCSGADSGGVGQEGLVKVKVVFD